MSVNLLVLFKFFFQIGSVTTQGNSVNLFSALGCLSVNLFKPSWAIF